MLVPGIKVDRVLKEDGRVVGISAGGEEMRADVVIAADGVNSFITQEAGLRQKLPTDQVAVGVKELVALPAEVIEERFRLTGNEGTAFNIVGVSEHGVEGGAFLYTNRESISIGLVMRLDDLVKHKVTPQEILAEFLANPSIAPIVKGGKLLEYGAHLVPEGGLGMMPTLVTDGMLVVGDAAGLGINNGFVVRGMDLAIGSAIAAADAVVAAKTSGDFTAAGLSAYTRKLEESFVMADMRTYARSPQFLKNDRLYQTYPAMLETLMTTIYRHDGTPKEHLVPTLQKTLKHSGVSMVDLVRDVLSGVRAL
jgi:electron transfer flavoprotein-quinone oxidoreductase